MELFVPTNGPWVFTLRLQGPKETAYESSLRLQVKVNAAWPRTPPEVRVGSWIRSPWVTSGGVMDAAALSDAVAERPGEAGLVRCVRAALALLNDKSFGEEEESSRERFKVISKYREVCRHPWLFDAEAFTKERMRPEYWHALENNAWSSMVTTEAPEVYSVPLFTSELCRALVEELDHFHATGLPARRPNSMNNYGIVVNEIGMEPALDALCHSWLQPLAHHLFPGVGSHFDRHHSFVVRYKVGEDLGLDMHTDDSDVTFNICLGKDFKGAGLQFCGDQGAATHRKASLKYQHRVGHCVIHRGHRRHGADDITEGERLNLIIWARALPSCFL